MARFPRKQPGTDQVAAFQNTKTLLSSKVLILFPTPKVSVPFQMCHTMLILTVDSLYTKAVLVRGGMSWEVLLLVRHNGQPFSHLDFLRIIKISTKTKLPPITVATFAISKVARMATVGTIAPLGQIMIMSQG